MKALWLGLGHGAEPPTVGYGASEFIVNLIEINSLANVAAVKPLSIFFVGDVVGVTGRAAFAAALRGLRGDLEFDLVVANCENSADSGHGISRASTAELIAAGAGALTTGNHAFDGSEAVEVLESDVPVVRPLNFRSHLPGRGWLIVERGDARVGVLNLASADLKRVENSPLLVVDRALADLERKGATTTVIDIHGAWPAEKRALAHRVDGRACAVVGTHTHVPTADAQVLPGGTAFISDVGMTGAVDSLIGFEHAPFIDNLLNGGPEPSVATDTTGVLMGALIRAEGQAALSIERVEHRVSIGPGNERAATVPTPSR
jgi:2',3'-cyclic-nucleotide 2'-phosphodiesterase